MTNEQTKKCTGNCGNIKNINNFYICKANKKDGHKNICKECLSEYNKKYLKDYCEKNKERLDDCKAKYRKDNRKDLNNKQKIYSADHKKEKKEYDRIRYQAKKLEINNAIAVKRNKDISFKIAGNLRCRLRRAIEIGQKTGSAVRDLGCSVEYLIDYFKTMFYTNPDTGEMMSWDNYGQWHIDHIAPLSSFNLTDREQFLKACNFTNLQPLWAKDNLKKSDKIQ